MPYVHDSTQTYKVCLLCASSVQYKIPHKFCVLINAKGDDRNNEGS